MLADEEMVSGRGWNAKAEPSQAGMKFTVVVTTYNYAHLLPDALRALAAQTLPDFELLIIDDGSTDNTEEVVERFLPQFQDCRYLKKPNGGPADARNFGVQQAQGTHIAFLDADDLWSPLYLQTVRDRLIKSPQTDMALSNGLRIRYDGAVLGPVFPPGIEVSEGPVNAAKVLLFLCTHFLPSGMVIRKSLYDRIGPFDTRFDQDRLGDDVDWFIRAVISGAFCLPIYQKLFLYRIHGRNLTANPANFLEPWLRIYTERIDRGPLGPAYGVAARSFTREYVLRLVANYPLEAGRSMIARTLETLRGDFILRCAYFFTYFGLTYALGLLKWAKRMTRKRRAAQRVDLTAPPEIIFQSL
ncbi:MAG TPA: glycosyltransferase family A protein [Terriglobia bacterium]|nr:glycosyltransferase family A protein [Terriglobia bacterium]